MKKHGNKNLLKIAALTSMSIFTLFTCFSAAIAWYIGIKNNAESTNDMRIENCNGILEKLSIHQLEVDNEFIRDSNQSIIGFNFDPNPASEVTIDWARGSAVYDATTPSLGQYSLLQRTNPLLLVFEFVDDIQERDIQIEASCSRTYTAEQYESMASSSGNPLSWVIKYSHITYTSSVNYSILSSNLTGEGHFAEIDQEGNLTAFNKDKQFFSGSSTTVTKYVCIVLDYYEEAMSYFYTVNLGKAFLNDIEHDVPFYCDWTMVV